MSERIPVAVLGATGSVGQRFIQLLDDHPWFKVVALTGSTRSKGMSYGKACHWILDQAMPAWAEEMIIQESDPGIMDIRIAFSALPSTAAQQVEPRFAQNGVMVCSNASAYRTAADVPILLPEVNPAHTALINRQRSERGWTGGIVTNSNCTSTGMSVALKALHDAFVVKRVFAVSLQAVSGAGLPGVPSIDILDNVIPYIGGEEEKVEREPLKMLGRYQDGEIEFAPISISAHTNRVAVSDGHILCLSVSLESKTTPAEAAQILTAYQAPEDSRNLPSTPRPVIAVRAEDDRPQPRLDRATGNGMTTVVGRLREDPIFDLKMVVLSHNTVRGAAGGSLYNAELLVRQGWIQ